MTDGPGFRVIREHVDADGTRVIEEFEILGIRCVVDPSLPPNEIRFVPREPAPLPPVEVLDPDTGEWVAGGIVQFHQATFEPDPTIFDPMRNLAAGLEYARNAMYDRRARYAEDAARRRRPRLPR